MVRFDGASGSVLKRRMLSYATGTASPDMLLSADGRRLYLAKGVDTRSGALRQEVALLDPATLRTKAVANVPDRIRYIGPAPGPTMALSPNGRRLFVYSYDYHSPGNEDDWLVVIDAKTMRVERTQTHFHNCGAERMATSRRSVLVLCDRTAGAASGPPPTLYFVDPVTARITRSLVLPDLNAPFSNLTMSQDGKLAFVAGADLGLIVVNTQSHQIVHEVTSGQLTGKVSGVPSTAESHSSRFLFAAITEDQGGIAGRLNIYSLPSLQQLGRFDVQAEARIFAARNGFYSVPMSGSASAQQNIVRSTVVLSRRELDNKVVLRVKGAVYSFVAAP